MIEASRREILRRWAIIPLRTKGGRYLLAVVDRIDYPLALQYQWKVHYDRYSKPSARTYCGKTQRWLYLRRLIAENAFGPCPGEGYVCENLDGDLLDCQRGNLKWSKRNFTEWRLQDRKDKRAARMVDKGLAPSP